MTDFSTHGQGPPVSSFADRPATSGPLTRGAPPIAVLGPTNTGKTHYAIERMTAYGSGMIGLPLRLLAREVFDRVVEKKGARAVALVTGEEKIIPPSPSYWVCTVEAMPLDREVDFLAIDEIQLAADLERGRVFTSRLLHARGQSETLLLGSETMRPILRRLFPQIRFLTRDRLSTLTYSGAKKVTRLPRRSAVVGFSADNVYGVAELIRRQRGGAAVVLGVLSPRTRNAQAALYQSGEVDYLVATDAIGMGLNMDIDHVAFAASRKFDGRSRRALRNDELAQVAGRAGRNMRDGTFGVTGQCPAFDEDVVSAIEDHQFDPVTALQWRTEALDFSSIHALTHSLAKTPPRMELQRARQGDDEAALFRLIADEDIKDIARGGAALSLLWSVCETPDFRKVAPDAHARLLSEIYLQLARNDVIANDWLHARIDPLDRADGDIDSLSTRIAHVRTWTYLSHRAHWLQNAAYWQERTRGIEDSLSDALHEKLTQRFVDRRTSVLLKKLKDETPLLAGVNEDGEVIVEGQFVGRLLGFEFIVDPRANGLDAKRMRVVAERSLAPLLAARAAALANAATEELGLRDDGSIWWRSGPVARLEKGPAPLRPNLVIKGLDTLSPHLRGRIQDRLLAFLAARVEALLGELIALQQACDATGDSALAPLARGVAFRMVENFGAMSRAQFGDDLKQLDQDERSKLRKLGVRFGEYTVFMPSLLKPAPARMLTLLWALWTDRDAGQFAPPKAGLVSLAADKDLPHAYYYASGYRPSGTRAVRIDMLERLAGQIRSERKEGEYRGGFEPTPQMMSLVGCSGEDFESILTSLGYRKQTIKVRKPAAAPIAPAVQPTPEPVGADTSHRPETATEIEMVPLEAPNAADVEASTVQPAGASSELAANDLQTEGQPSALAAIDASIDAQNTAGEQVSTVAPEAAEEVEVEIWRQAPRRAPNHKRRPQNDQQADSRTGAERSDRRSRRQGAEAKKPDASSGDGPKSDSRRSRDNRGHDTRPQRGKGGPPPRDRGQRLPPSGLPQHRKVADPNSPFAILAGLKDELTRQQPPRQQKAGDASPKPENTQ
ncbi:MAG: helicase-related protein [Amphiplicatus sp.]